MVGCCNGNRPFLFKHIASMRAIIIFYIVTSVVCCDSFIIFSRFLNPLQIR
nr:MAG TPA: hypothetical protein [Caudoviricetes sp.]DAZ70832.1 MAG TPA: hypothetical protein [Caudoviricetes sp.]